MNSSKWIGRPRLKPLGQTPNIKPWGQVVGKKKDPFPWLPPKDAYAEKPLWEFDATDYGFIYLKKFKDSFRHSSTKPYHKVNEPYEWFAEKTVHSFMQSDLGRTIGVKSIVFHVRRLNVGQYRIKIMLTEKPSDPYAFDHKYEGMWDCMISNGQSFSDTLIDLLEEVQDGE